VIGVFDSGVGGLTALAELRRLMPHTDITYLADKENAPYGTKSAAEIADCAESCISRLAELGAERILIACCTASTVYPYLSLASRSISVPIILPAARAAAAASENGRIAVIATHATVRSHAFSRAISAERRAHVIEIDAQPLVALVEGGARDGVPLTESEEDTLRSLLAPADGFGADALVLGCTHFPHLAGHISKMLPKMKLISPSTEGAKEMAKAISDRGGGRTVFI
jgi:glutamate racemase